MLCIQSLVPKKGVQALMKQVPISSLLIFSLIFSRKRFHYKYFPNMPTNDHDNLSKLFVMKVI